MSKYVIPEVLENSDGKSVPVKNIRKEHLKRHVTVEKIFMDIAGLETKLKVAKKRLKKAIDVYTKWLAKQNKCEPVYTNLTLSNYPNLKRVNMISSNVLEFDENLQLAKQKIDSCFERWNSDSNANLKVVVDRYFKVGKKGFIDKNSILSLFELQIKDKEWEEAMDLIRKSIKIVDRRQYVTLHERKDRKAEWKKVDLNFSSINEE